MMTPTQRALPGRLRTTFLATAFTLARWRLRQTWRLLLVMELGILSVVVLLCAMPLFTQVALTAGVRAPLTASPQDAEIELQANTSDLSHQILAQENSLLRGFMQTELRAYLSSYTQFVLQMPGFGLTTSNPTELGDKLLLTGVSIDQASTHLHVLQGQLPLASSSEMQIVITQLTASDLQVAVGSTVYLHFSFFIKGNPAYPASQYVVLQLPLHVVGIVALDGSDPFWHGQDFEPVRSGFSSTYRAIMSSDAFLALLDRFIAQYGGTMLQFDAFPTVLWYFFLNATQVTMSNLDPLITHLDNAQVQLDERAITIPYLRNPQLISPTMPAFGNPGTLARFRERIAVVQIPIVLLTLQILALLLLFVGVAAGMYADRQASAMALLRSRGASRRQVFSMLVAQTLVPGLLALLAGPALAVLLVYGLGRLLLAPADQSALNILTNQPIQTLLELRWYALIAVAGAIITTTVALWLSARKDALAIRRDLARARQHPIWQRLHLEWLAALVALSGYTIALYLTRTGAIDARTNQVIYLPVSLVGPIFLLIAAVLLFLRLFPLLLRFFARRTARQPSAPPMLVLAQMSRTPHYTLPMILLLALSISLAMFALVFSDSEARQIASVAAQQVGADFSGSVPVSVGSHQAASAVEDAYRAIPGVASVTAGSTADGVASESGQATSIQVRAVDTRNFWQTAIWTDQDSSQPLAELLAGISTPPKDSQGKPLLVVPALADAVAWNALQLAPGAQFVVNLSGSFSITFQAIAEVEHIPTINDSLQTGGGDDYITPGGLLVDFNLYAQVYAQEVQLENVSGMIHQPPTINYIWLRTEDTPSAVAKVRAMLTNSPLSLDQVFDRRAMLAQMQRDPLYLAMRGLLILGVSTTALLALIGSFLASWLNAKRRLTSFALLRALGSTPRQIASLLSWEQGVIYCVALMLGILLGTLLVLTTVPALVFTNPTPPDTTISSTEFFVIQRVLPVQIGLSSSLGISLAVLVFISIGAILLMARLVSAPDISRKLRLSED
ncbi:MAG TPA: FtsX-like permease family protein [Ktedonobacterales bacterium]